MSVAPLPAPRRGGGLEHLTPVDVINKLDEIEDRISKGLLVCDRAFGDWQDADLAFDAAEAHAYVSIEGPVHERRYRVVLEVLEERKARDVALRVLKRAERQLRHLEGERSRWQSTNKNVMQAYEVAGLRR